LFVKIEMISVIYVLDYVIMICLMWGVYFVCLLTNYLEEFCLNIPFYFDGNELYKYPLVVT